MVTGPRGPARSVLEFRVGILDATGFSLDAVWGSRLRVDKVAQIPMPWPGLLFRCTNPLQVLAGRP